MAEQLYKVRWTLLLGGEFVSYVRDNIAGWTVDEKSITLVNDKISPLAAVTFPIDGTLITFSTWLQEF